MTTNQQLDDRAQLLAYLERQMTGPVEGDSEVLHELPHRRYLTGILYPSETDPDATMDDEVLDEAAGQVGDDWGEDPVALSGQMLPSSVGLSFVLPSWQPVTAFVEAARYVKDGGSWRRSVLRIGDHAGVLLEPPAGPGRTHVDVFDGSASIDVVWRRFGAGALVTAALVNRRHVDAHGRIDPSDCLLQVKFRCVPVDGVIAPYPTSLNLHTDEEEAELALLYRKVPTFAVGHGSAATWADPDVRGSAWVETTYLPRHALPSVAFDLDGFDETLQLLRLSLLESVPELCDELDHFVSAYAQWAEALGQEAARIPASLEGAATRLIGRVNTTVLRMRRGVQLLRNDESARRAFSLANRAMLMQMVHSGDDFAQTRKSLAEAPDPSTQYDDQARRWRPFQLAFLLLTVESIVDEHATDRELVDLIWFPTGGGKTEAYLGLVAFTIFYRRLQHGDAAGGTTVITRYTLRLLTAQQFQRAATLICACELLRRESLGGLGASPISIGVWVGGNNTPNSYPDAVELLQKLRNKEWTGLSFQVDLCPWCGTEIIPDSDADEAWGVVATNNSFRLRCPNPRCPFHSALPVSSVDADLYDRPPTMLVGTVDKFARMAWDSRAGVFLGAHGGMGPALIIQDEFHLISGPLGTIVGLYEAAFDVIMRRNGTAPKIVASTATIRRAEQQARGVFGRSVALFPPAGLDADDSYFVRFDHTIPGRLYAGVMPQGHTPLTGMVHLAAAMLQAPCEVALQSPADDAYWTLVAYHNSLRELGKSVTLAHDDIPARIGVIATAEDASRSLTDADVLELTSNVPPAEIPRNLEVLGRSRSEDGCPSFVASTNMISVGVDVPRLGLMLVVGQPKTTAEYIQATSRVGRSSPGLVVTLYSPSKPRDRSHYESFVPYHSALYRAVEPTSVTPFSVPARARALHADLVILARQGRGWSDNNAAAAFSPDDSTLNELLRNFLARASAADPDETDEVARHIAQLVSEWAGLIDQAIPRGGLRYSGRGRQHVSLLRRFSETGPGWATLDSMRSIDVEVRLKVRGEDS